MQAAPSGYPNLVDRAVRLIEARGQPIDAAELARELFGAAQGPWARLLDQVVSSDGRLASLPDGRYGVVVRAAALACAGLVVFGAGPKPWRDPILAIGAARWVGDRLEQGEWLVRPT